MGASEFFNDETQRTCYKVVKNFDLFSCKLAILVREPVEVFIASKSFL